MNKHFYIRTLNALMALVLMGVLTAAYYQQYFKHEMPCPLCILQRAAMLSVAIGTLMNLRFGIHPKYYGFSLLSAFVGGAVSIRQMSLHICPCFPIFGLPVYGLNLYTWAFLAFCSATLAIILFLFFYSPRDNKPVKMNLFEKFTFIVVATLAISNFVTTIDECGLGFCKDVPWPQEKTYCEP